MDVAPSPNVHSHDVGELVEASVNVTVSGPTPEVGVSLKLATGTDVTAGARVKYVLLMSVGEEAVLTVLARAQAKLGLVFLDMRRAAEELAKIV